MAPVRANRLRTTLAALGAAAALTAAPAAHAVSPADDTKSATSASPASGGATGSAGSPGSAHSPRGTAPAETGPEKTANTAADTAPNTAADALAASGRHAPCTGAFRGDSRLGPKWLPRKGQGPVGPLLRGWQRTGGLSPSAFLKTYWEGPADTGGWKYPPNDGFAEVNGKVDKRPEILVPGEELDRFGSEFGSYLAPAGDPYAKRALPPQNLNTRDAAYPCDYHVYEVAKPFTVWQGSIAPWFGQPGGGQQIKLDPVFLNPGEGQRLNVKWLLDHGYLEAEEPGGVRAEEPGAARAAVPAQG